MPDESLSAAGRAPRRPRLLGTSIAAALLVGVAFIAYAVVNASKSETTIGQAKLDGIVVYSGGSEKKTTPVRLRRLGGGGPVLLGGRRSTPTVVNFFASWCTICRQELDSVAAVARADRVPFIGVDTDDESPTVALRLLRQARATYPVGVGNGSLASSYGAPGLPTTAFLDREGRIVAIYLGALTRSRLTGYVDDLLAGRRL